MFTGAAGSIPLPTTANSASVAMATTLFHTGAHRPGEHPVVVEHGQHHGEHAVEEDLRQQQEREAVASEVLTRPRRD